MNFQVEIGWIEVFNFEDTVHRWIVESTIALGNHRRLLTRREKNLSNFSSFTLLGCLMLTLRHMPFS